jgi:Arc/MetJ family transcription regulator
MRTTITLDPDVETLLKAAMRERDVTFKDAVNQAIRNGLKKPVKRSKFIQSTFSMGAAPHFRWDKALGEAAAMEDEEIVRKLDLRK